MTHDDDDALPRCADGRNTKPETTRRRRRESSRRRSAPERRTELQMLNGMRVIESAYLEEDGEPYTVRRTWRERLFTLPWRPWNATNVVVPRIPYRGALQLNPTTLVMHPQTLRDLRRSLSVVRSGADDGRAP